MLIKVFGIWLNPCNIDFLSNEEEGCGIYMNNSGLPCETILVANSSCDEVAEEINRQIKESK